MQRKLKDSEVIEIKKLLKEGKVSSKWIREKFNVTLVDINNIKNRGYYKDLDKFVE